MIYFFVVYFTFSKCDKKIITKKKKNRDKIKLSIVIHSGTLLSNKISISLKINFREETMETNLSASLNQPHKASRETTKPKKHFISQQGGVRRTSPVID